MFLCYKKSHAIVQHSFFCEQLPLDTTPSVQNFPSYVQSSFVPIIYATTPITILADSTLCLISILYKL